MQPGVKKSKGGKAMLVTLEQVPFAVLSMVMNDNNFISIRNSEGVRCLKIKQVSIQPDGGALYVAYADNKKHEYAFHKSIYYIPIDETF